MILQFLSLLNFKNHQNLKIQLSNSINCFLGPNGVGKTNLLDSIHYLSFCKSYYNITELSNIFFGEDFFMIQGNYMNPSGLDLKVNCALKNNQKIFKINEKKYPKLSNHIGRIPLVIITPLDSTIILGGGDERRRFVDKLLSQLDANYMNQLISYNKILQQRNSFLKDVRAVNANIDLLATYNKSLSDYGNKIFKKRKECLNKIIKIVQTYYDFISQKSESVDIVYKSQLHEGDFSNLLNLNIEKDKLLTYTSVGIHRDDFVFNINSHSLKKTGSQGQQKTFLIALKFAYFELLKLTLGITPLLLLDDIFDKLDNNRVEQIVRIINRKEFGQIFITDTNFERIDSIMRKVSVDSKYFIFNKSGLYEERFKNKKN